MKKVIGLVSCLILSLVLIGSVKTYATDNLIINGSGEEEMTGWTELQNDGDPIWWPSTYDTNHSAVDGDTFFWPSKRGCSYACMYQDVDVSGYAAGTWMSLSAWLANYDQSPHDQATLKVQIFDAKSNVLYEDYSLQRNPEWQFHELNFALPVNASTVRVLCIADRFVGSDNDAYFDDIVLTPADGTVSPVIITGDKTVAKPGDTIQLSASDGKYKKASYYEWSSSYNDIATVDENGLVTMTSDPDESLVDAEVWIYAKSKKTGVIGKYFINSERENIEAAETGSTDSGSTDSDNTETGNTGTGSTDSGSTSKPEKVTTLSVVSVKLKWTQSKNATGYYVYKYNEATGKYKKIATIKKGTTTTYTAKNLEMDNEYKFKIVAYKTKGSKKIKSADSNIVTVILK